MTLRSRHGWVITLIRLTVLFLAIGKLLWKFEDDSPLTFWDNRWTKFVQKVFKGFLYRKKLTLDVICHWQIGGDMHFMKFNGEEIEKDAITKLKDIATLSATTYSNLGEKLARIKYLFIEFMIHNSFWHIRFFQINKFN